MGKTSLLRGTLQCQPEIKKEVLEVGGGTLFFLHT